MPMQTFTGKFCSGINLAVDATTFVSNYWLGKFVQNHSRTEEAILALEEARGLQPYNADVNAAMGTVLYIYQFHQREFATYLLALALRADPTHELALLAFGFVRPEIEALQSAANLHPARAEAWLVLGALLTKQGGQKSSAEQAFRQALDLSPRSRHVVDAAGTGLRFLGFEQEALGIFRKAVTLGLWSHPLQRPRHIFWPELTSSPLLGTELENAWPRFWYVRAFLEKESVQNAIRQEFRKFREDSDPIWEENGGVPGLLNFTAGYWSQQCNRTENETACRCKDEGLLSFRQDGEGSWAEYRIWDQMLHSGGHCAAIAFPQACHVINELILHKKFGVSLMRVSITEVYPPRTYIPRHSSSQQGRLRLLCPLDVPNASLSRLVFRNFTEFAYNESGVAQCLWFDESFEHELYYSGSEPRASLYLDFVHPALHQLQESGKKPVLDVLGHPEFMDVLQEPLSALREKQCACWIKVGDGRCVNRDSSIDSTRTAFAEGWAFLFCESLSSCQMMCTGSCTAIAYDSVLQECVTYHILTSGTKATADEHTSASCYVKC